MARAFPTVVVLVFITLKYFQAISIATLTLKKLTIFVTIGKDLHSAAGKRVSRRQQTDTSLQTGMR